MYIRSLYEANKSVSDPRQQRVGHGIAKDVPQSLINGVQVLIEETEKILNEWKHPDPYRPPEAPGGATNISMLSDQEH